MSVRWNPVLVTKMQIAPTLTVLTAAHVNKDLLEMVQFVKVCKCEKLSTIPFLSSKMFVDRS